MIEVYTPLKSYTLTSGATAFGFDPLQIWSKDQLKVTITEQTGVIHDQHLDVDYTVSMVSKSIDFTTPPFATYGAASLTIASKVAFQQPTDLSSGSFTPDRVEHGLDYLAVLIMQLHYVCDTAPDSMSSMLAQALAAQQAALQSKLDAQHAVDLAHSELVAAKADAASSASDAQASKTAAASSTSDAQASKTAAASSASDALASKTAAAGSASDALASKTAAASSASDALASKTAAASSASDALASKNAAAASAAAAAASITPHGKVQFLSAGTFNWTVPAGVTSIDIELIGGGGGAGGAYVTQAGDYQGGPGTPGTWGKLSLNVTPGTQYALTVGAGGVGGNNGTSPTLGGCGGATSFGSIASVVGGTGGTPAAANQAQNSHPPGATFNNPGCSSQGYIPDTLSSSFTYIQSGTNPVTVTLVPIPAPNGGRGVNLSSDYTYNPSNFSRISTTVRPKNADGGAGAIIIRY